MPFVLLTTAFPRTAILVCDGCDGVLMREGQTSAKTHRDSDPDDLARHYDEPFVLRRVASSAGWTVSGVAWKCGRCSESPEGT